MSGKIMLIAISRYNWNFYSKKSEIGNKIIGTPKSASRRSSDSTERHGGASGPNVATAHFGLG